MKTHSHTARRWSGFILLRLFLVAIVALVTAHSAETRYSQTQEEMNDTLVSLLIAQENDRNPTLFYRSAWLYENLKKGNDLEQANAALNLRLIKESINFIPSPEGTTPPGPEQFVRDGLGILGTLKFSPLGWTTVVGMLKPAGDLALDYYRTTPTGKINALRNAYISGTLTEAYKRQMASDLVSMAKTPGERRLLLLPYLAPYRSLDDIRDFRLDARTIPGVQEFLAGQPFGRGISLSEKQAKAILETIVNRIEAVAMDALKASKEEAEQERDFFGYMKKEAERRHDQEVREAAFAVRQAQLDATHNGIELLARIVGKDNPEFGNQISVIGGSFIQLAKGLNAYHKDGALGSAILTGNALGAAVSIVGLFANRGPSPEQQILKGIGQIKAMLNQIRTEMHSRFDQVDRSLDQIYGKMNERFDQIDLTLGQIRGDIVEIQSALFDLQSDLNRIEQELADYVKTGFRRTLTEAASRAVGYREAYGISMSYETFLGYHQTFHDWAAYHSIDPLETGGEHRSYRDSELLQELSKPLSENASYALRKATSLGAPAIADETLPNWEDWLLAVNARIRVAQEWPEHAIRVAPAELEKMLAPGKELLAAITNITLVTITGRTPANISLFQRLFAFLRNKANVFTEQLLAKETEIRNRRDAPYPETFGVRLDEFQRIVSNLTELLSRPNLDPALKSDIESSVLPTFEGLVRSYRSRLNGAILSSFDDLQPAGNNLTGAKALLETVMSLGFSQSVQEDDFLRALLHGRESVLAGDGVKDLYERAVAGEFNVRHVNGKVDVAAITEQRIAALEWWVTNRLAEIERTGRAETLRKVESTVRHLELMIALQKRGDRALASRPVVTVTSPAEGSRLTNGPVILRGTASGAVAVDEVYCWIDPTRSPVRATGTTDWTGAMPLLPGSNSIFAMCVDKSNSISRIVSRTIFYSVATPVHLAASGNGNISQSWSGNTLEIGRTYSVTATPQPGHRFSHWSGSITSAIPTVTFSGQSNFVLQAHFIPNPFPAAKGTYNGLFYEFDAVRHGRAGSFAFYLSAPSGGYTAALILAGRRYPASGKLDLSGNATNVILRPGTNGLVVVWHVDLISGDVVTGEVSDGNWTARLEGDRSPFNAITNPAPQEGRYTLIIPGNPGASDSPQGDGYGTTKVDRNGVLTFLGTLADGLRVTQRVPISKRSEWPLYVSGKDKLLGWMVFQDRPSDDLHGLLSWTKPASTKSRYYPAGFSIISDATGSRYRAPLATNNSVLSIANATVTFSGGNLPQPFANDVMFEPSGKVTNLSSNKFSLAVVRPTGLFSGTVVNPESGQRLRYTGSVHQKGGYGTGSFQGTNEIGRVTISR